MPNVAAPQTSQAQFGGGHPWLIIGLFAGGFVLLLILGLISVKLG